jgi:hypothetical protein
MKQFLYLQSRIIMNRMKSKFIYLKKKQTEKNKNYFNSNHRNVHHGNHHNLVVVLVFLLVYDNHD